MWHRYDKRINKYLKRKNFQITSSKSRPSVRDSIKFDLFFFIFEVL